MALFVGQRQGSQLARLYASLDVFVHTGPLETFCQAIQEALASGVPVVAPAAGGPLDLVQHGRTGFLVSPGDGSAIATAVADLACDPVRRAHFGRAARESVKERTWAAVGDELIAHYRAACGVPWPVEISDIGIAATRVALPSDTPARQRRTSVP